MKPDKTKKKVAPSASSGKVKTTREKMMERKKMMESRGNGKGLIFPKEGTLRIRLKSPGPEEELGIEVVQFYLGPDLGGVISPATFDEPCPFMERYKELKNSSDDDDKALAKLIVPKTRYVVGGIIYKDEKGKEVDEERIDRGVLIPTSVYQDITDLYLDVDEWGDMTDNSEGYDIKISRSGKGKNDTTYSVSPCQKKPLDKKFRGYLELEKIVRAQIKSYDELEELLNKFLKLPTDDEDDEDERPKKKSFDKKKPVKKGFKKPGRRDI